jgi:haloalkane dehalogenase
VLLMHGEPSWAYLYRKIISTLVARGHRVIAPDLIGFGRSDKPAARGDYTYERHVAWMSAWLEAAGPDGDHVVLPGLGRTDRPSSGRGLSSAVRRRWPIANTGLPTGSGMTDGFKAWLGFQPEHAGDADRPDRQHGDRPRPEPGRDRRL